MDKQINRAWQFGLPAAIAAIILLAASGLSFTQPQSVGAGYGSREPHVCKDKKNPTRGAPSPAQAAEYVACDVEGVQAKLLYLVEDVKVQIGAGRPFNLNADPFMADIDPKYPVYPIRGSFKQYQCEPMVNDPTFPRYNNVGKNCTLHTYDKASGKCWKTTFGDWRCTMSFDAPDPDPKKNVPPPGGAAAAPQAAPREETANKPQRRDTAGNGAKNDAPNQQGNVEGGGAPVNAGVNQNDAGLPAPDTTEMSPFFDVVRFKYDKNTHKLTVLVKTKTSYDDRPRGWYIHFYDEDGVDVIPPGSFAEIDAAQGAGKAENFEAYLPPSDEQIKRVKKVVISRNRD